MAYDGRPMLVRFWEKVDKSDQCWVWKASINNKGYGRFGEKLAHRVSWEIVNGPVPDGMAVCHRCDNPPCVRPDHLFLGSNADNTHDMLRKGRGSAPPMRVGAAVNTARLTAEQVRAIRGSSRPAREIATELGVSKSAVVRARSGRSWGHL